MSTRRGFTLMEVLVALALIGALFAALFTFHYQLLDSRDAALRAAARDSGVDQLFESVETAMQTSLAEGFSGTAERLDVSCRGVSLFARGDRRLRDVERRTYRVDAAAARVMLTRSVAGETASDGEILSGAWLVRFRYHDGESWSDAFRGSGDAALPVLVEVAVWFDGPADDDVRADVDEEDALDELDSDEWDEFGDEEEMFDEFDGGPLDEEVDRRPDRLRVIAIPDARPRAEMEDA